MALVIMIFKANPDAYKASQVNLYENLQTSMSCSLSKTSYSLHSTCSLNIHRRK